MLKFLFPCLLLHYIKCRHLGPTLSSEKRRENVYCLQILWFFGCANLRNTYKTLWNILITCLTVIPQLLLQVAKSSVINSRPLAMPGNPGHFAASTLTVVFLPVQNACHTLLALVSILFSPLKLWLSLTSSCPFPWYVFSLERYAFSSRHTVCLAYYYHWFTEALLDAKEMEHTGKLSISYWWCGARRSCGC